MSRKSMKWFIQSTVSGNQVVVFSKSSCTACHRTKSILLEHSDFENVNVKVYDVDLMRDGPAILQELVNLTGQPTIPSVWVNGEYMGGVHETQTAWESGALASKLEPEDSFFL